MRPYFLLPCVMLAGSLIGSLVAGGADWTGFRGSLGNGFAVDDTAPVKWDAEKGVVWKAKLPRPGNGSAIVSKGLVFVTSAEDDKGHRRSLYCFDRRDGAQKWVRTVELDKDLPTHGTNPYCGTTPVADGERVVVWHASAGLYCYDYSGKELWRRDLGEFRHMWGYGTSPVLFRDRVLLHSGPGKRILLTALNLADGNTLWELDEPYEGDGEHNEDKKYMGSWCTPVLTEVGGKFQAICAFPTRLVAVDPLDGKIIWSCDGIRGPKGDLAYSSPVIVGETCVVIGGFNGPGLAVRLGGRGNVTESHRLWRNEQNPQSIGTGVAVEGSFYRPNAGPGTIECLDPQTGKVRWTDRAGGANHWASIVSANGLLYATNQNGTTIVFQPNPEKFELVSSNELKEPTNATPAISDGQLFFRTSQHLICIGAN